MIDINPKIQEDSEPGGYEFRYYTFDTLPALEVSNIETTQDMFSNNKSDPNENLMDLPLDNDTLLELQQKGTFSTNVLAQIERGNIIKGQVFKV